MAEFAILYRHGMGLEAAIEGSAYQVLGRKLTWKGTVRPTAASRPYTVRISFRIGKDKTPNVEVLSPELVLAEGKLILPHYYRDGSLCLFHPKYNEWSDRMLMARTILPWAIEWLYYYELWRVTGEWFGGGEDHLAKVA